MEQKIKPLRTKYNNSGTTLELIERKGDYAIYGSTSHKCEDIVGYEVHKIRIKPVGGVLLKSELYKDFTHYEVNPSNEDFGYFGWMHQSLAQARKCLNLLNLRYSERRKGEGWELAET